jgi:hypothetical protein
MQVHEDPNPEIIQIQRIRTPQCRSMRIRIRYTTEKTLTVEENLLQMMCIQARSFVTIGYSVFCTVVRHCTGVLLVLWIQSSPAWLGSIRRPRVSCSRGCWSPRSPAPRGTPLTSPRDAPITADCMHLASVADPESGAFSTPGSGIRNGFKNQDQDLGWIFWIIFPRA